MRTIRCVGYATSFAFVAGHTLVQGQWKWMGGCTPNICILSTPRNKGGNGSLPKQYSKKVTVKSWLFPPNIWVLLSVCPLNIWYLPTITYSKSQHVLRIIMLCPYLEKGTELTTRASHKSRVLVGSKAQNNWVGKNLLITSEFLSKSVRFSQ